MLRSWSNCQTSVFWWAVHTSYKWRPINPTGLGFLSPFITGRGPPGLKFLLLLRWIKVTLTTGLKISLNLLPPWFWHLCCSIVSCHPDWSIRCRGSLRRQLWPIVACPSKHSQIYAQTLTGRWLLAGDPILYTLFLLSENQQTIKSRIR